MLPLLPLLLCAVQEPAPIQPAGAEKVDLRVLYAGRADSERSARFAAFLGGFFAEVGRADYSTYTAADADGYDVVILDCEVIPEPGRIGMVSPPALAKDYDRATVVIGGAVMAMDDAVKPKLDWL